MPARNGTAVGGLPDRDPLDRDSLRQTLHWTESPWTETLLDSDPPWTETPVDRDPMDRNPRVNRITDRCKNITLPQLRLRAVVSVGLYREVTEISLLVSAVP